MKNEFSLTPSQASFRKKLFLSTFRMTGNLSRSAEAAGVSRQIVYYWKKSSSKFAERMLKAKMESDDKACAFVLKKLSEHARDGNKDCQQCIRGEYGEKALRSVLRGKNLTWKGQEA